MIKNVDKSMSKDNLKVEVRGADGTWQIAGPFELGDS